MDILLAHTIHKSGQESTLKLGIQVPPILIKSETSILIMEYSRTPLNRIVTARHPNMQKIGTIGFFFENRLHCQSEFRLLLFRVCNCF
jgi:hypothetical protein